MLYWLQRKDVVPLKRLLRGTALFFLLCTGLTYSTAAAAIRVTLDDTAITFDEAPFIENDRVLVPMRGILESLGYTVHWQEHTKTVLAVNGDISISLPLNSKSATVNGKTVSIDAPAQLKSERAFVPLRFLAEYSGANVTWNSSTNTVSIQSKEDTSAYDTKDSVVYIQTNQMQGSGVVLSADGIIVTNYHVIENASTAQFIFQDDSLYQGETTVIGLSPEEDIAILRIGKTDLQPVSVSTDFQVGEAVTAVGSPYGHRNLATTGTINGYDQDRIATSAVITKGSSGGGLFNASGKLIGISCAFNEEHYLSIPIANVLQVPRNLSIPLREMKNYTYTPHAPQNLRYEEKDGYAYVSWSPIYGAEYYYVSISYYANGPFKRLQNTARGGETWLWGYPECFGIKINRDHPFYLKVSAVVDGKETAESTTLKIEMK